MGNIGPLQLLIVLALVLVIFGTKKLRGSGSDLGAAIRGFKKELNGGDDKPSADKSLESETKEEDTLAKTIDKETTSSTTKTEKE